MGSEQKITDMQVRVRRWLQATASYGEAGTLDGLDADVRALDSELKSLFPTGQVIDNPLETLKEQAILRTVLESVIEGVVVADVRGQVLVFNAAARELLGQDATDRGPQSWSEQYGFFHADGATPYRSEDLPLSRAMAGDSVDDEELIVRAPGRAIDVHISSSARPLWGVAGEQLGGVVVFHDVTRAKRLEKVLREATSQAEEASRAKSEFLANMSHEIRTPLSAVLGFAELLLDPDLGESDRLNYLNAVRRNGQHLLGLINDVLDLSKLQADRVQVERADFSLHQLLHEVVSVMQVRAHEKGVDFSVVYDTPIPVHIRSDAMRIRQILLNLLSNAIKFTPQGSVTLSCRCLDPGTDDSRLELVVTDTGIGMSEDEIEKLFQPFQQANLSTTRKYGGTGLGLAICRALSEALGGSIDVDSRPNEGSVFRLVLPQPVDADAEMVSELYQDPGEYEQELHRPGPSQRLSGRILLAEDGLDNQLLISTILRQQGLEVDIAGDGEEAVARALQAVADEAPYDLVLMDMQMPRLDGYGATAKLRSKGYSRPVVALTAHAMAGERERCIAAGCDDYLTKPIPRPILVAAVESYLQRRHDDVAGSAGGTGRSPTSAGANQPLYSSLAEDADLQQLVRDFVERLPLIVRDIQAAHDAGDTERLRRLAHQLKGSAGGYGFHPVGEDAAAVEAAARPDAAGAEITLAMEKLVETCQRVRQAGAE